MEPKHQLKVSFLRQLLRLSEDERLGAILRYNQSNRASGKIDVIRTLRDLQQFSIRHRLYKRQ